MISGDWSSDVCSSDLCCSPQWLYQFTFPQSRRISFSPQPLQYLLFLSYLFMVFLDEVSTKAQRNSGSCPEPSASQEAPVLSSKLPASFSQSPHDCLPSSYLTQKQGCHRAAQPTGTLHPVQPDSRGSKFISPSDEELFLSALNSKPD